ncbi:uncharacterized protein [Anabrus simplex]|uniref:uncharacterized protein n=1 Tax=Anabrus simplex TaxID=316456 RepID=UPI0034DD7781
MSEDARSSRVRGLAARWEAVAAAVLSGHGDGTTTTGPSGLGRATVSLRQVEQVLSEIDPHDSVEGFTAEPGGGDPERHTSFVQIVTVSTVKGGVLHLIFKTPRARAEMAKMLNVPELFRKETFMYKHVIHHLTNLWPDEPLTVFPRSYYSSPELLVLENLAAKGYMVAETQLGLDENHCTLVMTALGRFHAASLAYKEADNREASNTLCEAGYEPLYTESRRILLEPLFAAAAENTVNIIKSSAEVAKHTRTIEAILASRFDRIMKFHRPEEPLAVLLHGDLWADNIMFHYNELGEPDDVKFLDFQMCRYGSPALDINRFLYSSTTREVRIKHGDALLRAYHREQSRALRQLNVKQRYTLADLRREVHSTALYGLLTADLLLRIALNQIPPGATPYDVVTTNVPGDPFSKHLVDIVLELDDMGVLTP